MTFIGCFDGPGHGCDDSCCCCCCNNCISDDIIKNSFAGRMAPNGFTYKTDDWELMSLIVDSWKGSCRVYTMMDVGLALVVKTSKHPWNEGWIKRELELMEREKAFIEKAF